MVVFLTLNSCRKLRISVIRPSQRNISLISIFWVIWRKVLHTREALNFGVLHKNMNCAFPLTLSGRRPLSYRNQSIGLPSCLCVANQWTGFYMITAPVMKELKYQTSNYLCWRLPYFNIFPPCMKNRREKRRAVKTSA